jgi:hypothetical protein
MNKHIHNSCKHNSCKRNSLQQWPPAVLNIRLTLDDAGATLNMYNASRYVSQNISSFEYGQLCYCPSIALYGLYQQNRISPSGICQLNVSPTSPFHFVTEPQVCNSVYGVSSLCGVVSADTKVMRSTVRVRLLTKSVVIINRLAMGAFPHF